MKRQYEKNDENNINIRNLRPKPNNTADKENNIELKLPSIEELNNIIKQNEEKIKKNSEVLTDLSFKENSLTQQIALECQKKNFLKERIKQLEKFIQIIKEERAYGDKLIQEYLSQSENCEVPFIGESSNESEEG